MGPILTGNPKSVLVPPGIRQHDLDLIFAEQKPIPDMAVSLTPEEVRILGYFVRDLKEMQESAFMKDAPGTLGGGSVPTLRTATTDDEIRSFVTIFRRLYMEKEPANFQKAVAVYAKALGGHPLGKWVAAVASEFQSHLAAQQDLRPIMPSVANFTTKRLIDVFLYTQYAHQPDEKRQKQFVDCLAEVHGSRPILTWFFFTEIWKCALEIGNAGKMLSGWFDHWCKVHAVSPDVLNSLRDDHSGLGVVEKDQDRGARLFEEKVQELALELWKEEGEPEVGPTKFSDSARQRLSQMLER
jgi:hypothetical protein